MEPNTDAIIRMAWARELDVPDDAFAGGDARLDVPDDAATQVIAVRLGDRCVLTGPQWAIDEAEQYPDHVLTSTKGLLQLTRDHQPSGVRAARLMYTDEYVEAAELDEAVVSNDPSALADLLRRCAPDDLQDNDLAERSHLFVLLDDAERPVAAASYNDEGGVLADLAVVEAIDVRGDGLGALIAAVATNDALDGGLIPQIMVDVDGSTQLPEALGYAEVGRWARTRVR